MEQANQAGADSRAKGILTLDPDQTDAWMAVTQKVRAYKPIGQEMPEHALPKEDQQPRGKIHACRASRRGYQQARDRLKRADRDLGETAAFIAASLTTVTAVQAVVNITKEGLGLSTGVMQLAFHGYITIIILILLVGIFRARGALHRRAQAEREIDQTKKGIFEFCPMEQWPELE